MEKIPLPQFNLSNYDFPLNENNIAQQPLLNKSQIKMLVVNPNTSKNTLKDTTFYNFIDLVTEKDLIIFNDTKVIYSKLKAKKQEATIFLNLHKKLTFNTFLAFFKNSKRLQETDTLIFKNNITAKITSKIINGEAKLEFNIQPSENIFELLAQIGEIPLPPYIKRKETTEEQKKIDAKYYQTIFANQEGSTAAPTAGLLFDEHILKLLKEKNIKTTSITLHVGAGTFLPVKTQDITEHKMHSEDYTISQEAATLINETKKAGGRLIAVGTTSLRAIEHNFLTHQKATATTTSTNIFIHNDFNFNVDCLLTNFHLPKSSLFILVSSFCGLNTMQTAYKHAITQDYRFFSYGDCCFLHKKITNPQPI